jgi:hypothetical protein
MRLLVITFIYRKIKKNLLWFWFNNIEKPLSLPLLNKRVVRLKSFDQSISISNREGLLFIPGGFIDPKVMIVQQINLNTRERKCLKVAGDGHGHSIEVHKATHCGWLIPENGHLAFEFDSENCMQKRTILFKDRVFGGHGTFSRDGKKLFVVNRSMNINEPESQLVVYDTINLEVLETYSDIGIGAHDIKLTDDERIAVVASYGSIFDFFRKSEHVPAHLKRPSYSIIDLEKKKIIKKEVIMDKNVLLAHISFDPEFRFAFIQGTTVMNQKDMSSDEIECLEAERGAVLSLEELHKNIMVLYGVHLKIDLKSLEHKKLRIPLCRSQSMLFNPERNELYDTYAVSKKIAVIDADSFAVKKTIDCSRSIFDNPRGLALTKDNKTLIVSNRWKNLYCYDLQEERFVPQKTFYTCNWMNSHITLQ